MNWQKEYKMDQPQPPDKPQEPEPQQDNLIHIENNRTGLKIIVASMKHPVNELVGVADYIKKNYFDDLKK